MRRKLLILLLGSLCCLAGIGQAFNYVYYDTKDGLAGETIYDMCQDKDGFMWFATENGLSRYDGTQFRNFTVKDGLPDNEVLKIYPDSAGRLWIGSFNTEVCYYYKGNIYNRSNTAFLNKIQVVNPAFNICEDSDGSVLINDREKLFRVFPNNEVVDLRKDPVITEKLRGTQIILLTENDFGKGVLLQINDTVYKYERGRLERMILYENGMLDKPGTMIMYPTGHLSTFTATSLDKSLARYRYVPKFIGTINGAWSIDTADRTLKTQFLPGKKVSHVVEDFEKNIWFSTLGEGIYKLPSTNSRTIGFTETGKNAGSEVFCIEKYKGEVVSGLGFSKMAFTEKEKTARVVDFSSYTAQSTNRLSTNRLLCSKVTSSGMLVLGFDAFIARICEGKTVVKNIHAIKSIEEIDSAHVLVGMHSHALKLRVYDLEVADTIWAGRCTKVFYFDKKYYIGTINGLYEVDGDKKPRYLGELDPALERRITDMKATAGGILWIATNDMGLVAYKDGKVLATITEKTGLGSNICKTLFVAPNHLWVGTNKGICKVDLDKPHKNILKYTSSDGLPSDIVNALYVEDSTVWVGSPEGLTYFNEHKIANTSQCRLQWVALNMGGRQVQADSMYKLSYTEKSIRLEYVAISFKSSGDIVYYYKLTGLDTGWQKTRENFLNYQSLPPGNYQLQMYATNKFGVKSSMLGFRFSIATPYWRSWWFYTLVVLACVAITGWLVNRANQKQRKRLVEKANYNKQFAALEQQALQAQMNPHFIFNCLNSIQQYILTNNQEKANEYLTGFAALIRQTLDNSGKKSVTVAEEVNYLSKYLSMEQMRYNNSFAYEIGVGESLDASNTEMAALLLQPYVENALRHGIRYRPEGCGKVCVTFATDGDDVLVCKVRDNGVGRKKAAEYKSRQHIEYQSKGMSLTEKRISLLNQFNEKKITVVINDLEDEAGNAAGTEVIVKIPI